MSSPEPRELPSPVQFDKHFLPIVDKDFSARPIKADGDLDVEQVAAPKAPVLSVMEPASSQTSEMTDLIPPPEDLTAPVEPGPSQLAAEEESLPSTSKTNPGVNLPPVVTPTPTSSSLVGAK